jgi:hypothetical protein
VRRRFVPVLFPLPSYLLKPERGAFAALPKSPEVGLLRVPARLDSMPACRYEPEA